MQLLSRGLGRLGVLLCTFLLLARCGGSDLTLPSDTSPANLVLVDGNNQSGAAGERLGSPLIVKVTDRRGAPVEGQQIAFTLVTEAPGAVVQPDTARSDSTGQAVAEWTLGNVRGTQRVVAQVVGLNGIQVPFDATVGAGAAVRLEMVSGNNQTAAVGTPLDDSLVVRVLDQFGNPVSGRTVDWEPEGGSVDPSSVVTGSDGRAATYRILGSSTGPQTATASAGSLEGSPVTFTSQAVAGSANELVRVSGDNQSAAPGARLPQPLVVRLVDRDGNGVSGRAVSWVVGAGGGQVDSPNSNTDGSGEADVRWTMGSAGTNTLNAVVSGVGVVGFTAQATGGGGGGGGGGGDSEPARLEFRVQPSNTREKKKIEPAVEVEVLDRDGHRFTGERIRVNLELIGERDGRLKGDASERTESGVATFSDLQVERDGDYRLRASADGLPSVDSNEFEVHDD